MSLLRFLSQSAHPAIDLKNLIEEAKLLKHIHNSSELTFWEKLYTEVQIDSREF